MSSSDRHGSTGSGNRADGGPSALEARVHGRVQGVGFRYYTQHTASRIGVTGWVRNEPDGSVLVYAEGTARQLQALEDFLHRGPSSAHVTSVDIRYPKFSGVYHGFSVEH